MKQKQPEAAKAPEGIQFKKEWWEMHQPNQQWNRQAIVGTLTTGSVPMTYASNVASATYNASDFLTGENK